MSDEREENTVQPEARGSEIVRRVDDTPSFIFADSADLFNATIDRKVSASQIIKEAQACAIDLMVAIGDTLKVEIPEGARVDSASRRESQKMIWDGDEIAKAAAKYRWFDVVKLRVYVRTKLRSPFVSCFDVLVPTYNGEYLFDPTQFWKGDSRQMIGFRVAPDNSIPVVEPGTYVTDTKGLATAKHKCFRAVDFAYAKKGADNTWAVKHTPRYNKCKDFVGEWTALRDALTDAERLEDTTIQNALQARQQGRTAARSGEPIRTADADLTGRRTQPARPQGPQASDLPLDR